MFTPREAIAQCGTFTVDVTCLEKTTELPGGLETLFQFGVKDFWKGHLPTGYGMTQARTQLNQLLLPKEYADKVKQQQEDYLSYCQDQEMTGAWY